MPSDLRHRVEPPIGYKPDPRPEPPIAHPVMPPREFPIPTPPEQGYAPNPVFRSPMPALLTSPDQQRNFYGRGMNVRRFWPATNGTATVQPTTAAAVSTTLSQTGTVKSASGTTASWVYKTGFLAVPQLTIVPLSNAGAFYVSSSTSQGFTITYATSGAQSFNFTAVGV
jgi:hypothetical protein